MTYQLPPLPYSFDALEPHIDAMTMEIHHDRHHKTYVDNLNKALESAPELGNQSIEELLRNINQVPENIRTAVRNNGGGHANHSLFWEIMGPNGGGQPSGALGTAINSTFGDFATFQEKFNTNGTGRFGSGWSWLVVGKDGTLQAISSPNQDSPYMDHHVPILGCDVWEHAYYLKYQNKRADYLKAWWNTINWDAVAQRYEQARGGVR
jgi:Fe-Mn family superoxide dismutase